MRIRLTLPEELAEGAQDGPVREEEVLEQGEPPHGGPRQQLRLDAPQGGAVRHQGAVQALAQGRQVHGGVGPVPVAPNKLADTP